MLLDAAMSILSRLSKVAGSVIVDIIFSWTSSPQAEEAGHSVADCVPSAVDLVLGIFAGNAFGVAALVSSKRISVDQCLFKSSAGCLDDLDRPALPANPLRNCLEPGFVLNFHFSLYFVLIAIVGVFFVFF